MKYTCENPQLRSCKQILIKSDVDVSCPQAVIPSYTVDTVEGIKEYIGSFVHVTANNTTFYIDDQGRPIIVWAGPVFESDYDYATNPKNIRSQVVYDFANNRAIVYGATGAYRLITLTEAE